MIIYKSATLVILAPLAIVSVIVGLRTIGTSESNSFQDQMSLFGSRNATADLSEAKSG